MTSGAAGAVLADVNPSRGIDMLISMDERRYRDAVLAEYDMDACACGLEALRKGEEIHCGEDRHALRECMYDGEAHWFDGITGGPDFLPT